MSVEVLEDIKIVRYTPNYEYYIDRFEYDGIEKELADTIDIRRLIKYYASMGDTYIGVLNGKMIGIGGIAPIWVGVGFAWLFLNKSTSRYKKSVFKKIKIVIDMLLIRYHRIQTQCLDIPQTKRLLEHLGFQKEGVMRNFANNKDMIMYAILRRK